MSTRSTARSLKTIKPKADLPQRSRHPTRDKLLDVVVALLETHLPQTITSEMVLKQSGISRGSLYHHFQDFAELLELAMVHSFAVNVDRSIAALTSVLLSATKKADIYTGMEKVTAATQGPGLRAARFQRARLISFSEDNPRLSKSLAVEQQRLTDAITDLIREAQMRGWMNKTFDPYAAAVLIQAYTLGKIVDDISLTPMSEEAWNSLIVRLIQKVFG
jgi:AcrR family transcriptional regulator